MSCGCTRERRFDGRTAWITAKLNNFFSYTVPVAETYDRRLLGIRAVAAVTAVGADELTMQIEHLRSAHFALLARRLKSFRSPCLFPPSYLVHISSIRVLQTANTAQIFP